MSDIQSFGKKVRARRKFLGYTLRQLAPLLKIDFTYLSKLENDRADHPPSEDLIRKIAEVLDLDQERLLYLAGRITQGDAKMIENLVKSNPDGASALFRKMRENPEFADKFIRKVSQSDSSD